VRLCRRVGAFALCLLATHSVAWNDAGHKLVALVAYDSLPENARETLLLHLGAHPRFDEDFVAPMPAGVRRGARAEQDRWLFTMASEWPDVTRHFDHVRSLEARERLVTRYHHPRWHYINLPLFLDDADRARLMPLATNDALLPRAGVRPDEFNLVQALVRLLADYRSPGTAAADRAVMLCWILHLMADLHQPLHTVAFFTSGAFPEGDRGGNLVRVGQRTNLHGLWDSAAGHDDRWGALLRVLGKLPRSVEAAKSIDLAACAREGQALAADRVYVPSIREAMRRARMAPVRVDLPQGYLGRMRATAERQIVLAGRRTATVVMRLTRD